jgi:hypothetical protein
MIPHAPMGIADSGSFEVRFPDGRPSKYFHWDDNPGRASITNSMNQEQARQEAGKFARVEVVRMKFADSGPASQNKPTSIQAGGRVKLSKLGRSRFPRAHIDFGTVVHVPRGGQSVKVLFDGNTQPTRLHQSYIQPA